MRPCLNIFSGSPPKVFSVGLRSVPVCFGVMRKLMQHPLGECGGLKRGIGCTSLTWEYCTPLLPFGIKSCPLSWKCCYPLPAGFPLIYPTENTFGGDPDRSPLKGDPPFRGKPDAIDALRSNRWTFGSGTLIRFHPRGVKMSEFRDSSRGTRSEASVSAFSRSEEE